MKILQFCGSHPNFGDELNTWLWPRLLPGFFDQDPSHTFIGIGSTIGGVPADAGKKIVFGSGFVPHYHAKPEVKGDDWRVYFVRGPRTAARLGIGPNLAISDSGILARTCVNTDNYAPSVVSFMPHWESMERGNWKEVCHEAGINLIDPRRPVNEVFKEMLRSKLVIAEAMHGAIIADALRIPWVPVVPINSVHRDKWYDWAESLGMTLQHEMLTPSSFMEVSAANFSSAAAPIVEYSPAVLDSWVPPSAKPSLLTRTKRKVEASALSPWINARLVDLAANKLMRLSRMTGQLSADAAIEQATARMMEKLDVLEVDYGYVRYSQEAVLRRLAA
jgi:succinoglycan biosynthesis protein ExoV